MVCPFAGQSLIVLRTVNKIKPKQSSSQSPSPLKKSHTVSRRNLISGIIKKKPWWKKHKVRIKKESKTTVLTEFFAHITIPSQAVESLRGDEVFLQCELQPSAFQNNFDNKQ